MSSGFLKSDFSFVELPRRLGKVIKNAFDGKGFVVLFLAENRMISRLEAE